MVGDLAGLVVPVLEPVGFGRGWGEGVVDRIRQATPSDLGGLVLGQQGVDDVLSCNGLWRGKQTAVTYPANIFQLRDALLVQVVREFLEASVVGVAGGPYVFVEQFLANETNFDPLTATWLFLQSKFERVELEHELGTAICGLVEAWPQVVDSAQVSLGPVVEDFVVGNLVLAVDTVDVTFGEHRSGVEVNWPGAVLVRFVANMASPQSLETMALAAVVHGIATGCPPQRLVVWGLKPRRGIGMDVERDWLEIAVGGINASVKAIGDIRNDRGLTIQGGTHCVGCPFGATCDVSEADVPPF